MNVYLGDIHGKYNIIKGWINRNKDLTNCNIIQCGDFGIGFNPNQENHELKLLNNKLKNYGHNVFVVRGNHDNPEYFDGNHDYENIKFVPDYTVLNLNGFNHLFVGGAISIDRTLRSQGFDYWFNERFNYDEIKTSHIKNVEILVTHSCMTFNKPVLLESHVFEFAKKDYSLIEELQLERKEIDKFWNNLILNNEIKYHFYGHFHFHNHELINNTKHILLDINEFFEIYQKL